LSRRSPRYGPDVVIAR